METRYSVRQAADITGVKSYVLRYWKRSWIFVFREMKWVTVTTPDMIFNYSGILKN